MMDRKKNVTVEFLKFIAVLLIINSHADIMYPRFSALATGGAIGDCLFLFVSGFSLFLGQQRRFDNYFKRRLRRIFPSVISALIFIKIMTPGRIFSPLELAGGEFIIAIFCYYILLYFVRSYAVNKIPSIIVLTIILSILVYILFFPYKNEVGEMGLYGISTPFRWLPYFAFMLLGSYLGLKESLGKIRFRLTTMYSLIILATSLILFYGLQLLAKISVAFAPWQILTLLPLFGVIFSLYIICDAQILKKIFDRSKNVRNIILFVAGLCLESYLIQFTLITDKLNAVWPLNLIIIFVLILICSYLVRCLARLISQTFSPEDYNWSAIFKPI